VGETVPRHQGPDRELGVALLNALSGRGEDIAPRKRTPGDPQHFGHPGSAGSTMNRTERDFAARPPEDLEWMMQNTWCDACAEADLGMDAPREYEEGGHIYVEGKCRRCREVVRSEVVDRDSG